MKPPPYGLPVNTIFRILAGRDGITRFFLPVFWHLVLPGLILLGSCENDIRQISQTEIKDTLPVETVRNLEVVQTEQGMLSFILTSPLMVRYEGSDPVVEFPEGVHIVFYDTLKRIRSELSAMYGISYEKRYVMEARRDVEVINHLKNEKLNTEHLIWDRNKKIIYSEVFVMITTEDKTIYGENGLEADERFDSWKLKKVRGDIRVDKERF